LAWTEPKVGFPEDGSNRPWAEVTMHFNGDSCGLACFGANLPARHCLEKIQHCSTSPPRLCGGSCLTLLCNEPLNYVLLCSSSLRSSSSIISVSVSFAPALHFLWLGMMLADDLLEERIVPQFSLSLNSIRWMRSQQAVGRRPIECGHAACMGWNLSPYFTTHAHTTCAVVWL